MITGLLVIERAILAGGGPTFGTITGTLPLERTILSTDPPPLGAITGTLTIARRVYGTETVQLILNGAPTGLVGTLTIEIQDADSVTLHGPTTSGIIEQPAGTGRYVATIPVFDPGDYFAIWSDGINQVTVAFTILASAFVETFITRKPPARYDELPWTSVAILEGASRKGPFLELETLTIDPVDTDPADPAARNITIGSASLAAGWFALSWIDDDGRQHMTDPEYHTSVIQTT